MKKTKYLFSLLFILCLFGFTRMEAFADNTELITGSPSKTTATNIRVNQEYAAQIQGDETLYFKFTTPNKKGFYDFYSKNIDISTHSWSSDNQVQFILTDIINEEFARNRLSLGSESSQNLPLEKNKTYYISVHNNCVNNQNPGNFKIKISFKEDKENDDMKSATNKRLGEKINGSLDGRDDVDCFKIKTNAYKEYDFYAKNININTHSWSGDNQFRVVLQDSLKNVLADYHLTYGRENKDGNGAVPTVTLKPNTVYYILVYDPWKAQGNYTVKLSQHRNNIRQAAIQLKKSYTYTGKSIKPNIKVVYGSSTLKKNKDYTVSYSDNKKPGIATIKISGIGAYKGSYKVTFKILPAKAKLKGLTAQKNRKVTVKITQDKMVSGYDIQYSTKSSFKGAKNIPIKGNKNTIKQISKLKASTKYFFRVRSYKKVGSQKLPGAWSKSKSIRTKK